MFKAHADWMLIVTTNTGYASLQIAVALVCLTTVCFSGIRTNETVCYFLWLRY